MKETGSVIIVKQTSCCEHHIVLFHFIERSLECMNTPFCRNLPHSTHFLLYYERIHCIFNNKNFYFELSKALVNGYILI